MQGRTREPTEGPGQETERHRDLGLWKGKEGGRKGSKEGKDCVAQTTREGN